MTSVLIDLGGQAVTNSGRSGVDGQRWGAGTRLQQQRDPDSEELFRDFSRNSGIKIWPTGPGRPLTVEVPNTAEALSDPVLFVTVHTPLNISCRCGCRPNARQMRAMLRCDRPVAAAMPRWSCTTRRATPRWACSRCRVGSGQNAVTTRARWKSRSESWTRVANSTGLSTARRRMP